MLASINLAIISDLIREIHTVAVYIEAHNYCQIKYWLKNNDLNFLCLILMNQMTR